MTNVSRQVQQCKPYPDHVERYVQVVKDLKERDTHAKNQDREVVKRSFESGKSDDPVDVGKFDRRHLHQIDIPTDPHVYTLDKY